MAKQKATK